MAHPEADRAPQLERFDVPPCPIPHAIELSPLPTKDHLLFRSLFEDNLGSALTNTEQKGTLISARKAKVISWSETFNSIMHRKRSGHNVNTARCGWVRVKIRNPAKYDLKLYSQNELLAGFDLAILEIVQTLDLLDGQTFELAGDSP